MPVMSGPDRRTLVDTLTSWLQNATAGVECSKDVPAAMIALIKRPSDKPEGP